MQLTAASEIRTLSLNGTMSSPHFEQKALAQGRNFVRIPDLKEVDPPFSAESSERRMFTSSNRPSLSMLKSTYILQISVKDEDLVVLANEVTSATVSVVDQSSVHIAKVLRANPSATLMMMMTVHHNCRCVLTHSLPRDQVAGLVSTLGCACGKFTR